MLIHQVRLAGVHQTQRFPPAFDGLKHSLCVGWRKVGPKTHCCGVTPPKTNIEPENGGPLEKEIPIGNHHFYRFQPSVVLGVKLFHPLKVGWLFFTRWALEENQFFSMG